MLKQHKCYKCKMKTNVGSHQTVAYDYAGDEEYQEWFCVNCGPPDLPEPNYKDINHELELAQEK